MSFALPRSPWPTCQRWPPSGLGNIANASQPPPFEFGFGPSSQCEPSSEVPTDSPTTQSSPRRARFPVCQPAILSLSCCRSRQGRCKARCASGCRQNGLGLLWCQCRMRLAWWEAVRSSSPELLAAKPASVLWSLLSDLGATCSLLSWPGEGKLFQN